MKLYVVRDKDGNILGSSQVGTVKDDKGTEIEQGIIAGPYQSLDEIEVDDSVMRGNADEIHKKLQGMLRTKK
jgi:hypothetical protein